MAPRKQGGVLPPRTALTDRSREAMVAEYLGITVQELRRRVRAGEFAQGPARPKAIDQGLDEFLQHLRRRGQDDGRPLRPLTLRSYTYAIESLRRHLAVVRPGGQMHEIRDDDLRSWLSLPPQRRNCGQDEVAPATRLNKLVLLRQIFRFAQQELWLSRSPLLSMRNPSLDPIEPRHLTEEEYGRLLAHVTTPRDRLLFRVMGECGPRPEAALKLQVRDVRLHPRDGDPPHLILRDGKGGKDGKAIVLPPMVEALGEYLVEADLLGHPSYYLFHPRGKPWKPLDPSRATGIFHAALGRRPEGTPATPHSLRHRFGHHLAVLGTDLDDIRVFMGHLSVHTTERYTVRTFAERHKKVLQAHPLGGMQLAEK